MLRVGPIGLRALFASIVTACGSSDSTPSSSTSDSVSSGPGDCEPQDLPTTVSADDVADLDALDGNYPLEACEMLCAEHFGDNYLESCGPLPAEGGESSTTDIATTGGADEGTTTLDSSDAGTGSSGGTESGGTDGAATVMIRCTLQAICPGGRASDDLCTDGVVEAKGAARWFASMAHSEAASIVSFLRLAAALAHHGAAPAVIDACRDAARDEARHARIMRRFANEANVVPQRPRHAAPQTRSLETLAIENAVEGCVHETWAALEATWQAEHAGSPQLRAAMHEIAGDETRHAALAWELDAWLRGQLSSAAWTRVEQARAQAIDALVDRVGADVLDPSLGLATRANAKRMVAALRDRLW